MKIVKRAFLIFTLSLLPLCYAAPPTESPSLRIEKAWLKKPIPGMKMTAAYMTLINQGEKDAILLEVKGDDAEYYEIHTVSMKNGRMKMRQLKEVVIKANSTHQLKPGGDHIMVIQVKKTLLTSKETSLTLIFKGGHKETIRIPITKSMEKK